MVVVLWPCFAFPQIVHGYVYMYVHVCVCVCVCVCPEPTRIYMCTCKYMCVYACVFVYTHTHIISRWITTSDAPCLAYTRARTHTHTHRTQVENNVVRALSEQTGNTVAASEAKIQVPKRSPNTCRNVTAFGAGVCVCVYVYVCVCVCVFVCVRVFLCV